MKIIRESYAKSPFLISTNSYSGILRVSVANSSYYFLGNVARVRVRVTVRLI